MSAIRKKLREDCTSTSERISRVETSDTAIHAEKQRRNLGRDSPALRIVTTRIGLITIPTSKAVDGGIRRLDRSTYETDVKRNEIVNIAIVRNVGDPTTKYKPNMEVDSRTYEVMNESDIEDRRRNVNSEKHNRTAGSESVSRIEKSTASNPIRYVRVDCLRIRRIIRTYNPASTDKAMTNAKIMKISRLLEMRKAILRGRNRSRIVEILYQESNRFSNVDSIRKQVTKISDRVQADD